MDSRVRNLYRTAEPAHTPCCKRINCNHDIRFCLRNNSLHDLRSLHTGLCHHSGSDSADPVHFFMFDSTQPIFFYNMARHQKIIHNLRPKRIGSDRCISQPNDKDRLFFFQIDQFSQMCRNLFGYFPVIVLIRCRKLRCLDRNIRSLWPSHGFCPIFRHDFYNCRPHIFFFIVFFMYLYTPYFRIFLRKPFCCFKRKIRPDSSAPRHICILLFFHFFAFCNIYKNYL